MKKIALSLLFLIASMQFIFAQEYTIATYNIRYENSGDSANGNGWKQRVPVITKMVQFHDFDIFGSQELLHKQLLDMSELLPEYNHIGVGRDDGKTAGEYAAIFYKKDKFEELKSGQFWLAEDMTKPGKGWDAAEPRICTWTRLMDKKTGFKLWFFTLHMDHIGVEARRQSAKLVLAQIKEMCGDEPVIVCGDFNVDQTHQSYKLLANSDILKDSYDLAKIRYAMNGTFNHFKPNVKTNSRLDHIFLSPVFNVTRYGILTDVYWIPAEENKRVAYSADFPKELEMHEYISRTPSDHYPVMIKINFDK